MCEPTTIALAATALSGTIGAVGAYQQGQVAKQVGRNNQIMAEYAAQDALKRGEQDAIDLRRKADSLKGTQRSLMASRGLDLSSGTPAEILDQTDFFGEQDQNTARFNAKKDAWSSRYQGALARAQGDASARQANLSAFSTILGTASQVSDKWKTYKASTPSFQGYGGGY
jgi:hypothetical protein